MTRLVDKWKAGDVIYLDLCEAFDMVRYHILSLYWRDTDLKGGVFSGYGIGWKAVGRGCGEWHYVLVEAGDDW